MAEDPRTTSDLEHSLPSYAPYYSRPDDQASMSTVLYHVTSPEKAKLIKQSGGTLFRGAQGAYGGGIYFAATPSDANHKARHGGVLITCSVQLGVSLRATRVRDYTFTELQRMGYDSVVSPKGPSGAGSVEFVVYDYRQVKVIRMDPYTENNQPCIVYIKDASIENACARVSNTTVQHVASGSPSSGEEWKVCVAACCAFMCCGVLALIIWAIVNGVNSSGSSGSSSDSYGSYGSSGSSLRGSSYGCENGGRDGACYSCKIGYTDCFSNYLPKCDWNKCSSTACSCPS